MKTARHWQIQIFIVLLSFGFSASTAFAGRFPMRSSGNNLPRSSSEFVTPTGSTLFLALHGQVKTLDQGSLLAELGQLFTQPLYDSGGKILFSYVVQTNGDGNFFLNLILEPSTADDASLVHSYVRSREQEAFHNLTVKFQSVVAIFEVASLEAGNYTSGQDDPFRQSFSLNRSFAFKSLHAWTDFTNEYGYALLARSSTDFLGYLRRFVDNDDEFNSLTSEVLSKSDMVAIAPKPWLILNDDSSVGPGYSESPFIPFKFYRNCYSPKFENGMCFKAPAP